MRRHDQGEHDVIFLTCGVSSAIISKVVRRWLAKMDTCWSISPFIDASHESTSDNSPLSADNVDITAQSAPSGCYCCVCMYRAFEGDFVDVDDWRWRWMRIKIDGD
jgi:hypothetical protein